MARKALSKLKDRTWYQIFDKGSHSVETGCEPVDTTEKGSRPDNGVTNMGISCNSAAGPELFDTT